MAFEVHVLASGSDGNCYVVVNGDRAVMIDCGISCKKLTHLMDVSGVDPSMIEGILVTHEHTDHTMGIPVVNRRFGLPIFCNPATYNNSLQLREVPGFNEICILKKFQLAGMDITPLPTSHDACNPCCYFFDTGNRKFLSVTDTGKMLFPVEHALSECDLAVIESNYDPKMLRNNRQYPDSLKARIASDIGHMSNEYCGKMIKKTQTDRKRKFFLAHLSKKNNTPDLARETVSKVSGIRRSMLDCLETPLVENDTRVLRL